jgi:hypothetical protein
MTLAEILDEAAGGLDEVERVATGAGTEWRRAGRPFTALTGERAAFLLTPVVGRAALGTPDTGRSERGSDWISFEPRELDRPAIDRAIAWFGSAWRHAGERPTD